MGTVSAPHTINDLLKLRLTANIADTEQMPPGVRDVHTQLAITHVSFTTATSTMSTLLRLTMRWHDERMRWNPDEYEDTERVLLIDGQTDKCGV